MKRHFSYRKAVEWIALNDEPGLTDVEEISERIVTMMVAELFDRYVVDVAMAIARLRIKIQS